MKRSLFALLLLAGLSFMACNSSAEKKTGDAPEKTTLPKATSAAAFNVSIDSLAPAQKEAELNGAGVAAAEWRDTYCPQCGNRCCSPCTAGGNPSQCAETRFRECGKCGHTSANHRSIKH